MLGRRLGLRVRTNGCEVLGASFSQVQVQVQAQAQAQAREWGGPRGVGGSDGTSYLLISAISSSICWSAATAGRSAGSPRSALLTAKERREVTEGRRRKSIIA